MSTTERSYELKATCEHGRTFIDYRTTTHEVNWYWLFARIKEECPDCAATPHGWAIVPTSTCVET